jgi:hypothetical protein
VFSLVHGVRRPGDRDADDLAQEYAERADKFTSEQWAGVFWYYLPDRLSDQSR